jgi:hypothetical protein
MRGVVGDQLAGAPPAGKGDGRGLEPPGRSLRNPLLEERIAGGSVDVALERRRSLA